MFRARSSRDGEVRREGAWPVYKYFSVLTMRSQVEPLIGLSKLSSSQSPKKACAAGSGGDTGLVQHLKWHSGQL